MTLPKFPIFSPIALVALGLAALPPSSAGAASLNVVGFDDMSCQAWSQSRKEAEQRTLYVTWIRGLLTGHNYARPSQQVSTLSAGTIEQYVNRYCSEHPVGNFGDAALRLSDEFSGRNTAITK